MSGEQTPARASTASVLRGYSGRLLLLLTFGLMAMQATRLVIPPLVPAIMDDYGISEFVVGVSLSLMWGLYSLLQYVSGRLSDQLTRKTPLVVGMAVMGLALGVLVVATTYPVFLTGIVLLGLGTGLYPTAAYALLSDHFVEDRGNALGVYTSGADLGGVLGAGLAVAALAVGVWQSAFLLLGVAAFATAVALHRFGDQSYEVARVSFDVREAASRLWDEPRLRNALFAYTLFMVAWQGVTAFLPAYLQAAKAFPPWLASGSFALLFVVGAVAKPTAGWLSDRLPRLQVVLGAIAVAAVALGAVLLATRPPAVLGALVVFAAGITSFPPVAQSYIFDILPDMNVGRDFGSVRTVYLVVGSVVGPSMTGLLVSRYGYSVAFGVLLLALVLTAAVLATMLFDR